MSQQACAIASVFWQAALILPLLLQNITLFLKYFALAMAACQ